MHIKNINNLITDFFKELNPHVLYCLARGKSETLYKQGSDIDVIINKNQYDKFYLLLKKFTFSNNALIVKVIKRQYVISHMIYFYDYNLTVQIDAEFNFDWWSFCVIESNTIISRRKYEESNGLYYASDEDVSFMKLYRTLLWGKRIQSKYKNEMHFLSYDFINKTNLNVKFHFENVSELIKYYEKGLKKKVFFLKYHLIIKNIKKYGVFSTIKNFLNFFIVEIALLNKHNGLSVNVISSNTFFDSFEKQLIESVMSYKAPFKCIKVVKDSLSLISTKKNLRNACILLFSNSSIDKDITIEAIDNNFRLVYLGVILYESDISDYNMKEIMKNLILAISCD